MRNMTVFYGRISLDRTGEEVGIERQRTETRLMCDKLGWTIDEELIDNDISATDGSVRPEFERLIERDDVERIVTWHIDRLVRKTPDLERVIAMGDVPVVAATSGHIDLSNPAGRAVARTIVAWATYEGEQKAERQRAAHRQRAGKGLPFWSSNPPLGYDADGAIVEHEAAAIRLGYEMILAGKTLADVARTWQEAGVKRRRGSDKPWDTGRVGDILRHPRNAALVTRWKPERGEHDIVGKAQWAPIVDEDQWRVALALMEHTNLRRRGQGKKNSLLSGVAKCMACGGPMAAGPTQRSKKDGSPMRYYRCRDRQCVNASMSVLDGIVEKRLLQILSSTRAPMLAGSKVHDSDRARKLADELGKVTNRLEELRQEWMSGEVSMRDWKEMSSMAKGRIEELGEQLSRVAAPKPMAGRVKIQDVLDDWRAGKLTLDEKQAVLREWFSEIAVADKGRARLRPEHVILVERW